MAKKTQKLKIVKVPLGYFPENYQPRFPPMPVMYLELLENKDKVKKELRNKDYSPPQERLVEQHVPLTEQVQDYVDNDFEIKDYSSEYPESKMGRKREPLKILDLSNPKPQVVETNEEDIPQFHSEKDTNDDTNDVIERKEKNEDVPNKTDDKISERLKSRFEKIKDEYKNEQNIDYEKVNYRQSRNNNINDRVERKESREYERNNERKESREYERTDERDNEREYNRNDERTDEREYNRNDERNDERDNEREYNRNDERNDERNNEREYNRNDEKPEKIEDKKEYLNDIFEDNSSFIKTDSPSNKNTKKIFDLLLEDDEIPQRNDRNDRRETTSYDRQNYNNGQQNIQNIQTIQNPQKRQEYSMPPKLSEINTGIVRDNKGVRDITRGLTKQEEEEDVEKRMFLEKFAILKKKYKEAKIPDFNNYTDLVTLKRTYESTVRNLQLDATVDNYKRYLMLGFGGTQWLITKFLKLDMTGFAEQQILNINQYESVLIEIGEKSYFKTNTASPEVRLMFLIGFNAVIFVMTKMMFNSGGNMMKPSSPIVSNDKKDKPHMRGPSFDDLKDFEQSKKTKSE